MSKGAASFLSKAVENNGAPEKVNIDCSSANTSGIQLYNKVSGINIEIRRRKYLNNIVEGVHFGSQKSTDFIQRVQKDAFCQKYHLWG